MTTHDSSGRGARERDLDPPTAAQQLVLDGLTSGEQRVVRLAVTGLSNREIATELFVTVKAIEWHLSNAYSKLGISGRTELADALG